MANAKTRALKRTAHEAFDPIWMSGVMTRTQAYKWLRLEIGLSTKNCHIGWMSDEILARLPELCSRKLGRPPAA